MPPFAMEIMSSCDYACGRPAEDILLPQLSGQAKWDVTLNLRDYISLFV